MCWFGCIPKETRLRPDFQRNCHCLSIFVATNNIVIVRFAKMTEPVAALTLLRGMVRKWHLFARRSYCDDTKEKMSAVSKANFTRTIFAPKSGVIHFDIELRTVWDCFK